MKTVEPLADAQIPPEYRDGVGAQLAALMIQAELVMSFTPRCQLVINDPTAHAELVAAFTRYETALMENDLAVLDELFWDSPHTLRYGIGENLHGIEAIREFRRQRPGGSPRRMLRNTVITTYGTDFGTASTEFVRAGAAAIGRQSQTWLRTPDGWRIVAAHVSMMSGFS